MALAQCRRFLERHRIRRVAHGDTAGAAKDVASLGDPSVAAIASSLAAEEYGLTVLSEGVEDEPHNTTRFLVVAYVVRVSLRLACSANPSQGALT